MKAIIAVLFVFVALSSAFDGQYTEDKYGSQMYICVSGSTIYGTYDALDKLGTFTGQSSDGGVSFQGTWIERSGRSNVVSGNLNFTRIGASLEGNYDNCEEDCEGVRQIEWNAARVGGVRSGSPFCMAPDTEPLANSLVGTWVGGNSPYTTLYLCHDDSEPNRIWGSTGEASEFFEGWTTDAEAGQTARGVKFFDLKRDIGNGGYWNSMRTGYWLFRQISVNSNVIFGQEATCTKNAEGTRCASTEEGAWVTYRRASASSSESNFAKCNSNAHLVDNSAAGLAVPLSVVIAALLALLF